MTIPTIFLKDKKSVFDSVSCIAFVAVEIADTHFLVISNK